MCQRQSADSGQESQRQVELAQTATTDAERAVTIRRKEREGGKDGDLYGKRFLREFVQEAHGLTLTRIKSPFSIIYFYQLQYILRRQFPIYIYSIYISRHIYISMCVPKHSRERERFTRHYALHVSLSL